MEVSKTEIKGEKSAPKDHQKAEVNSNVETKNTVVGSNKSDKKTNSEKDIKCEKCDYVCKEITTLNKHVNTRHTDQK